MRTPALVAVLAIPLVACSAPSSGQSDTSENGDAPKLLTLEQSAGRGGRVDLTGTLPRYRWASDGVHLELSEEEAKVWIDPVTWARSEPVPADEKESETPDGGVTTALLAAGLDKARVEKLRRSALYSSPNGNVLALLDDELWWISGGNARRLGEESQGALELREASPDGKHLAFVQQNDLVRVDIEAGKRVEVTTDGSLDVFNGKLDWVYQEELYGRGNFKAFWWSPDSSALAFLRLDESAVHDFTVIDHIEKEHFRVKPEITRYPKAGDPNPTVSVGIAGLHGSEVQWVDLSAHSDSEPLVVRVDWKPAGERLLFMLQDRIQSWMQLEEVDPATGTTRTLLRESSSGWVDRPEPARWLDDGSFLWLSERSGQKHLYRYGPDGALRSTLTSGDWSVRSIEEVDEERGLLWFGATRDGAVNRNHYRVGLDGKDLVRLTRGAGTHTPTWNQARTLFLDRHSSLGQRTRLALCDGEGQVLRELGTASSEDLEDYATSPWELHSVPARDGFELDVALLKPVSFDPKRSYPVWLPTYSGPDAPSVRNRWNGSSWYQFLAQNGVIVLQVNVRSASGKGQAVIESAYRQFGVPELADIEDVVDWLCAQPWADGERVGITGGSYGGFMTAYALTHSDRFALGIAASGVYDWRMYDTIYTERYMATPALNPEGYERSSVIAAAADLQGRLVITHGEMDDNVHLQNAIQLIWALQKAGKDFEFVLYPQNRHGIRDRDLRWHDRRMAWREIREHLLGIE
jgi:dipeptidyl-peptidase-4